MNIKSQIRFSFVIEMGCLQYGRAEMIPRGFNSEPDPDNAGVGILIRGSNLANRYYLHLSISLT